MYFKNLVICRVIWVLRFVVNICIIDCLRLYFLLMLVWYWVELNIGGLIFFRIVILIRFFIDWSLLGNCFFVFIWICFYKSIFINLNICIKYFIYILKINILVIYILEIVVIIVEKIDNLKINLLNM